MRYHEMTENYIFRELKCGLSIKQTADLCFKSVRTVKEWDCGKRIPPECKRLMRLYSNRELSYRNEWYGFRIDKDRMTIPSGHTVTPQQILTGIALLDIGSELELKTSSKLLRYARAIARITK